MFIYDALLLPQKFHSRFLFFSKVIHTHFLLKYCLCLYHIMNINKIYSNGQKKKSTPFRAKNFLSEYRPLVILTIEHTTDTVHSQLISEMII